MKFEFDEKISSYDFPKLLNNNWKDLLVVDSEILIDIVKLEWITGEAVTLLFALINELKSKGFKVRIVLPNPGNLLNTINEDKNKRNRHKRLSSLIDIWRIEESCDLIIDKDTEYPSNFMSLIQESRKKYRHIDSSWYKVIPFQKVKTPIFKNINNIREHLDDKLSEIYSIEKDTFEILNKFNSTKPFENQTLSHLLTTELYLNTIFHSGAKECYFSILLNSKYDETIEEEKFINKGYSKEEAKRKAISKIHWLKKNILPKSVKEERDIEVANFFKLNGKYINRNYIEFNYVDFGLGIPNTLEKEFDKYKKYLKDLRLKSPSNYKEESKKLRLYNKPNISKDSQIIEYAFLLDSSKEPFEESLEIKDYMPRGLFFLIEVVKRFEGLILIRSNKGKIIYGVSDQLP